MNALQTNTERLLRRCASRHEGFVACKTEQTIPATSVELLAILRRFESAAMKVEQVPVTTEHVLHGGMYTRTMRLKQGTVITGALIKRATLLIVNGSALMLVNKGFTDLAGVNVIPASAGRKQLFIARGDVVLTMIFATTATSIAEAEEQLTDEADLLLSRRMDNGDTITITGE